jgi:hypothetical protein
LGSFVIPRVDVQVPRFIAEPSGPEITARFAKVVLQLDF